MAAEQPDSPCINYQVPYSDDDPVTKWSPPSAPTPRASAVPSQCYLPLHENDSIWCHPGI